MIKTVYTVSEVTHFIRQILEAEDILQGIWIRGEVSNLRQPSSGHIYFTLKDKQSQLRSVMFKGDSLSLKFKLEDGLSVLSFGSISVYERAGQYQLYVRELQPEGLGALYLAFEQLKEKLEKEGLFEKAHKKPIPKFPQKIGVITSLTGAAVRDILTTIERRFDSVFLILVPAVVQGEEAKKSIVQALSLINKLKDVDVVILARGGGSLEELWAFNEELVARAIYDSRIPVVTGIGHETDLTIADLTADLRAPTPTAAAEQVVPQKEELLKYLASQKSYLKQIMSKNLNAFRYRLENLKQSSVFRAPLDKTLQYRQQVDELNNKLNLYFSYNLKSKREALLNLSGKLEVLSPLSVISRGYSICQRADDKRIVRKISDTKVGERIEVKVLDGKIRAGVEELQLD
ncbi:MAG: exodeoxyribonuclease VII large subunit [Armatimonadetes bacterium CG07_land_8_20_14_0_80_40_9]|nr:MAG: exodeoxyribonuclease VII large subunit [Armatimonadetes bacterium CG07_land_8_20_14_0_80_40_9]